MVRFAAAAWVAMLVGCGVPAFGQDSATPADGGTLRVLDRTTGQLRDIALASGEIADLGKISVALQECRFPTGNPSGDAYAYVEIDDILAAERVFSGWMIASAPALHALDHPRYDVWVIRCSTS